MVMGEMDGGITPRASRIHATLVKAGLKCELSSNILEVLWNKFLFICASGGVCSIARASIEGVLGFGAPRNLYVSVMEEVEAVAKAEGINLATDLVTRTLAVADGMNKATKPSMLRDLEHGKRLEIGDLLATLANVAPCNHPLLLE